MRKVLIRLLTIQIFTGLLIAAGFYVRFGTAGAVAAIYGGLVALMVSLMLAWRMVQAAQPGNTLRGLFIGAVERMLMVCIMFAAGMGWLHLPPLAIIAGFAGAELAYYVAAGPLRRYMLEMMGRRYDGD